MTTSPRSGRRARAANDDRPTVRDVAQVAGVSFKTVARVINGEPGVRPATAERVMSAVRQLGFRRNILAASLKRGVRRDTIGLVIDDVSNPFFATFTRAIEDVAWARRIQVIIASSDRDARRERAVINSLVAQRVGGLLVVPVGRDHRYLAREMRRGTAVVFLDRAPRVTCGPTRLWCRASRSPARPSATSSPTATSASPSSRTPWRSTPWPSATGATAQPSPKLGLRVDEGLVCHGANDVESAKGGDAALLASPAPPTAFFGANNQMTVGLVEAMTAAGRRIAASWASTISSWPDRCPSRSRSCALTCASWGGSRPSCCYVAWVAGRAKPQRIVLPVELVERGSGELRP